MKHTHIPILLSTILCAHTALAQSPSNTWTICTRELELIEAIVIEANEHRLVTVDEFGIRQTRSIDSIFFAIPTPTHTGIYQPEIPLEEQTDIASEESHHTKYISLTDGQIIKGRIVDSRDPDQLSYSVAAAFTNQSDASISLENILRIEDQIQTTRSHTDPESDTITMLNNDVLRGFVESVGTTTSIEVQRDVLGLQLNQINSIVFANIPERVPGIYISTNDDLTLRVSSYDFDFQHSLTIVVDLESLGLTNDARDTWLLSPDSPSGIQIVYPTQRVISLSTIEPELIEPTGDRDWTPTPIVMHNDTNPVLSSIDLRAPVRVVYPLPKGASRFACELNAPINTWTDCVAHVFSISYDGQRTELVNQRLNPDHPTHAVNVELQSSTSKIEIRIEPGVNGPIQDRVLVNHPRVLIES